MANIRSEGFSVVETLIIVLVIAVLGAGGWYTWHRHDKPVKPSATTTQSNGKQAAPTPTQQPIDPYAGWKTASLSSPHISFHYPTDWTVKATSDGKSVEVKSPASNGHYFVLSLIAGKPQDVNQNFLGKAPGTKLEDLTVDERILYLVAQTSGSNGNITGLGLATTPGGADTSFGITDTSNANNVTMVASLTPVTPATSDDGSEYSMQTYSSHPSYQDVLKVFQSLAGMLPQ